MAKGTAPTGSRRWAWGAIPPVPNLGPVSGPRTAASSWSSSSSAANPGGIARPWL